MAVSIFVKIGLHDRQSFIVPFFIFLEGGLGMLSFREYQEITGLHMFLNKVFI